MPGSAAQGSAMSGTAVRANETSDGRSTGGQFKGEKV
jgi:hypothetical protein